MGYHLRLTRRPMLGCRVSRTALPVSLSAAVVQIRLPPPAVGLIFLHAALACPRILLWMLTHPSWLIKKQGSANLKVVRSISQWRLLICWWCAKATAEQPRGCTVLLRSQLFLCFVHEFASAAWSLRMP